MTSMPTRHRSKLFMILWMALVAIVGCGDIRLESAYDENIDHDIGDVHTKVMAFMDKMNAASGKPEGVYEANKQFYVDIRAEIGTMLVRAKMLAKNERTTEMLGNLQKSMDDLEKLHQMGADKGLSEPITRTARPGIEQACLNILDLENKKKRGDS